MTTHSRNGRLLAPCYGSTENVSSFLHDVGDLITYPFSSGLREECTVVRCSSALAVLEILQSSRSSAIINHIQATCEAGSASMAYFYFDMRDINKQSRHGLLSSFLTQLSFRSDPFCDILHRLYKAHDHGARQPSDTALIHCLKEMLTLPDHGPVYLIMDALDDCPNDNGFPSAREQMLDLIWDLVGLQLPRLRLCVTSRPEWDIKTVLGPLASHTFCLEDAGGQKQNIAKYIRSVVYTGTGFMQRWRKEDKEFVIEALSVRSDGM